MCTYKGTEIYENYRELSDIGNKELVKFEMTSSEKAYTSKEYQDYLKDYLRCVKGVDDNVKRLIDYLEKEGVL